ncbi:MAG TPA: ABC transporter substrate-binding protein [Dehalococcoidia bacterium]|jgi:peptide/nickel transport system substrate-binding protein|nr:ABC transporter substrate-binding protein [Dehalococcoidia bacterium]
MGGSGTESYWTRLAAGRVSRRRMLGGSAALSGVAALALAGCSSSNNNKAASNNAPVANNAAGNTGAATSAPATAAAPPAGRTATPSAAAGLPPLPTANPSIKTGGTIQSYMVVQQPPLDPIANTTYSAQVYTAGNVYSRLFRFLSGPDPNTTLQRIPAPDLVQAYEQADPLTFTMHLRTDAMFHPPLNRPATTADVMASWNRFRTEPKNVNANVFDPFVDSLTAPDAQTLQFKLKQPFAPFLNKLANPQYLWILSQDSTTGKIDPSQQAIGTGPWILVDNAATGMTLKKNPNYFIKGIPYADGLVLNYIPQTANAEAQFQAGALDFLGVPAADVSSMQKAVPKATLFSYTPNGLVDLWFADVTQDPTFKDPRARQAASLSLDRDGFLSLIYGGKGAWSNLVNPGLGKWFLDPKGPNIGDAAQWYQHDPQKAKQLLQAAGYNNTQLKYIYPNDAYGDLFNQGADAVRGMMSDGGFNVQTTTVTYLKDYITPDGIFNKGAPPQSMVFAAETPFTEPDDYLTGFLVPGGNRNHDKVNDSALTQVVKAQQQELDPDKRLQLVYQAQRMQDDQAYYIVMPLGLTYIMYQPWVQNFFNADDYGTGTESTAYISVNNK